MNGSLKVVQAIVLLSFAGLFFTSCGGSQTTLASTTTSGTTTPGQTPASSGTESVEEEEKNATIPSGYDAGNMFVTVPDSIDYLNFSSLYSSYGERCTFTSSSLVNDLTCVFEVPELALFAAGITFQYNVPQNSCNYINTEPYWYYNSEIGTGPKFVSMTVTKNASGGVVSSSCEVDGTGPFACNTASPPDAWRDIEFDLTAEEIVPRCVYDNSEEDGGLNCCLGKYNYSTNILTPDGATQNFERGKAWGGSVQNCIGGAGKTDWEDFDAQGYPKTKLEKMEPNLKRTKIYKVTGPINKIDGFRSNMPIANFFAVGAHTHTGYASASGTSSIYPAFVDPISDRSGTPVTSGNPFYTFDCLDEAFETNARIRVLIQEWDTVAALQTYITSGVSGVAAADVNGTAPVFCPGLTGESCNQVQDSDDFLLRNDQIPGQSYSITVPSNRKNYFPKHTYR